jgi:pimeloyl-ACP methyl ester carboxylesterase
VVICSRRGGSSLRRGRTTAKAKSLQRARSFGSPGARADRSESRALPCGARRWLELTLILLHGGPGFDHTIYKPAFAAVADIAQVVYLDHRGNGRSDPDAHENWNLAQWGDDVRAFCDALEIARPIVYGASFGGMVALAYATRYPDH